MTSLRDFKRDVLEGERPLADLAPDGVIGAHAAPVLVRVICVRLNPSVASRTIFVVPEDGTVAPPSSPAYTAIGISTSTSRSLHHP